MSYVTALRAEVVRFADPLALGRLKVILDAAEAHPTAAEPTPPVPPGRQHDTQSSFGQVT